MTKTLKVALSFCVLLVIGAAANAQMIEPPPYSITSDYGPRKVSQGSFFHPAIDYGAPLYSSIAPVESGAITDIAYGGAWYVRLSGFNGAWSYLHLFTGLGTTPVTAAAPWELRQANLENPDTGDVTSSLVIIRWLVVGSTNAATIWSVNPGKIIKLGENSYVLGADNQPVLTRSYISALTDFIGPSGNSGGYPAHLDLRLNDGDDNPLYYLKHLPDSLPTATIMQPADGHVMTETELNDYTFKTEVNSLGGWDLDKVSFWIYQNKDANQAIHLGTPGVPTFGYGGRVGEGQAGNLVESFGETTGVQPFLVNNDSLGHDRFIFHQNLTALNLPDGEHSFVVRLKDVNGNEPDLVKTDFTVDTTSPSVYFNGLGPIIGTQGNIPVADESTKFVLIDELAGISSVDVKDSNGASLSGFPLPFSTPVNRYEPEDGILEPGGYRVIVEDAAGNQTSVGLVVRNAGITVSTTGSHITIDRDGDSFSGTIHVHAWSGAGLASVGLRDKFLATVSSTVLTGAPTSYEGDLAISGSLTGHYFQSNNFAAGFVDLENRVVRQQFNLTFVDVKNYLNEYGTARTSDFTTPELDLNMASPRMLVNGVMSVYAPTEEETSTLPRWWFGDGNGFYTYGLGNPTGEMARHVPVVESARENVGKVTVVARTWSQPDKSDLDEHIVADRDLFFAWPSRYTAPPGEPLTCGNQLGYDGNDYAAVGGAYCYSEHAATNQVIPIKRYMETAVTLERVLPASAIRCITPDANDPAYCNTVMDAVPAYLMAGPPIYGLSIKTGSARNVIGAFIPEGHNVVSHLPGGLLAEFGANTVFTPGMLRFGYASVKDYPGFSNLYGNLSFSLATEATFDHARLTIPYSAAGLTSAQESGIKIYKITDAGEYIALETTLDTVNKKVQSSEMDKFGRIMVAAPRYTDPHAVAGTAYAGGRPELEFVAEGVTVEQDVFDLETTEGEALLSSVAVNGQLVGNVYQLGTDTVTLATPGTLKMHYDASALETAGIESLSIYGADTAGTGLHKLSGVTVDPVNHELAVGVWQPYGLYMLVGSTVADVADKTAPEVGVSYGQPNYAQAGALYISTLTSVSLMGTDYNSAGGPVSGMATMYYLIDSSPVLDEVVPYLAPFTLEEGARALYYSAADAAGNMSLVSSAAVYVDGTPPAASVFADGSFLPDGGAGYMASGSSITLSVTDPEVGGVASGIDTKYLLVDVSPEVCAAGGTVPVACQNPDYTGPFTLSVGTHTLYYGATDKVGNQTPGKTAQVTVIGTPDVTAPMTTLWIDGVAASTGAVEYMRTGSSLTLTAVDPQVAGAVNSGVWFTTFTITRLVSQTWVTVGSGTYSGPIAINGEGPYTFYYHSPDHAGNWETRKNRVRRSDGTAAYVALQVYGSSSTDAGGNLVVAPDHYISFISSDPVSKGVASGLKEVQFSLDGAAWAVYGSSFTLAVGTHTLDYTAVDNVGNAASVKTVPFAVPGLGITPSSGPIGMPFAIAGSGFGAYSAGTTVVLMGGAAAPLTAWTDTGIEGTVPGALAPGQRAVQVKRGTTTIANAGPFTVTLPALYTVSPSSGAAGLPFTLTGASFGNYEADYAKVLIGGATMPVTLWTDAEIEGTLPALAPGLYAVQVRRSFDGGLAESATSWMNLEEPVISSMTPTEGPTGTVFNLYGAGFGSYDENYTRVTIGGAACELTLWTDTNISGSVPEALSYGTYTVVAVRGQALSNELEYEVTGGYRSAALFRAGTLAAEFKLGEVYVYPDPAKGGKVPVFHIEVGAADTVKLKVFTVAGQLAHEKTLTGAPQAIGTGYSYEYPWTGRIASGVYYYTVEAEKAGRKLKARGKFAVIR